MRMENEVETYDEDNTGSNSYRGWDNLRIKILFDQEEIFFSPINLRFLITLHSLLTHLYYDIRLLIQVKVQIRFHRQS
jgi:hypothetical protein